MRYHARGSLIEEMPPTIREGASTGLVHRDDPVFSDDPLLTIAYAIPSEQAITFLGPTFWMLLAYLFLVEELKVLGRTCRNPIVLCFGFT